MIDNDDMFGGTELLSDARERFFEGAATREGIKCPCCDRFGKIWVRPLNASHARALIWMYQRNDQDFHHVQREAGRGMLTSNSHGWMRHWGLVERMPNKDDPSKHQSGWYRITEVGRAFVEDRMTMNSHVITYDDNCWGWRDEQVSMSDILRRPFHYTELRDDSPP